MCIYLSLFYSIYFNLLLCVIILYINQKGMLFVDFITLWLFGSNERWIKWLKAK